jgi:S-formylglutathione hydrolase FrmB
MKKLTLISAIILTANLLLAQYHKIDTSFYSEALQEEKMVDVYFPPGYDENPDLYYPVIYYLHAWGGNQNTMNEMLSVTQSLINSGTIEPVIIVGADNSPAPFNGSMYMNSIIWGDYENYMVNDLISWVESSFRAMPSRDYRGLLGHSMGAYGSFRYGILYKDKFRALAAHASQITFDIDLWLEPARQQVILENPSGPPYFYNYSFGSFTGGAFLNSGAFSPDTNSPQDYINPQIVDFLLDENANFIDSVVTKFQQNDILLTYIHQLSVEDSVGIFFGCGTNDGFLLYPGHLAMKDTLDALGLPYEFYSHTGGHVMPFGFKQRALIFMDSLLMPPIITGTHQSTHQKIRLCLQNYPNPFDQSITIELTFREKSEITVSIYNQLGDKVATIFEGSKEKGIHNLTWNSENISSGIYFIKLQVGNEMVTKKIIKVN